MNHNFSSFVKDIEHPSETIIFGECITNNLKNMKKSSQVLSSSQHRIEHSTFENNELSRNKK